MSPLGGIYRSTRLGGQSTSPRDKTGYHGITSILNYHIWSCLIYSNISLTLSPLVGKGHKEAAAGSSISPCSNLSRPPCALIFLHQVVQQQQLSPFSSSNFLDHRNHQGCFSTRFPSLDFSTARTSRHQLLSFCLLLQSTLPNNSLLHLLLW